jgi:large subunit ribosomal protein L22e
MGFNAGFLSSCPLGWLVVGGRIVSLQQKNQLEVRNPPLPTATQPLPTHHTNHLLFPPATTQNFLRVVATSKDTYSLRYFKVDQDEEADEE